MKIFVKVSVLSIETSHTTKEIRKQDNRRLEGEFLLLLEFFGKFVEIKEILKTKSL